MQNKTFTMTAALGTSAANILNGAITSLAGPVGITLTQPVLTIKHIRAMNKSGAAVTLSLYKGATGASAAGTEFAFAGYSIAAGGYQDWYSPGARFESTDFLTGLASAATSITVEIEGEVGFQ